MASGDECVFCQLIHVQDQNKENMFRFTHPGRSVQTKSMSAAESQIEPVLSLKVGRSVEKPISKA